MNEFEQADKRRRQLVGERRALTREFRRLQEMLDFPETRRSLGEYYQRRGFPAEQTEIVLRRRLTDLEAEDEKLRREINQLVAFIMDSDPA